MEKFKINIDRQPISSEEIAKKADFNSLLKNYNAGGSGKAFLSKGWVISVASITAITLVCLWYLNRKDTTSINSTIDKKGLIPELAPGDHKAKGIFPDNKKAENTEEIFIPAEKIKKTEQATVEKFSGEQIANLPKEGKSIVLSSAEEVSLKSPEELKKLSEEIQSLQRELEVLQKNKPVKPNRANSKRFQFNIDILPQEFPELVQFQGLLFEIGYENKDFTPELEKIQWEKAEIKEGDQRGNYKLTLKKGKNVRTFVVYPVYQGADYKEASRGYAEYENKISELTSALKKKEQDFSETSK